MLYSWVRKLGTKCRCINFFGIGVGMGEPLDNYEAVSGAIDGKI